MAQVSPDNIFSKDNPVFSTYVFWTAILVLKMLMMSILTGMQRFKNKAFANPEDLPSKKLKVTFDNEDVERVRRAHRNDMENIFPFIVIAFYYMLTDPAPILAQNLFRIFAASRILHTIVYAVIPLPQPTRAIAFFGGLAPTVYMALMIMLHFL